MIRPEDFNYHFRPDTHWQWAETIFFPVNVPGTTLNGGLYVLTRPMLGVSMCSITFMDRLSMLWEDQAYIDNQQHLLVVQIAHDLNKWLFGGPKGDIQCAADCDRHKVRCHSTGEIDKHHPIRKACLPALLVSCLKGKACLADAARAEQGRQAALGLTQ